MNIIHVISEFASGGAEIVAINLAMKQSIKHDVSVITLRHGFFTDQNIVDWQRGLLIENNVKIIEIGGKNFKLNFFSIPFRLAKLFKKMNPDIVHSHTDQPDICVSLANRICKLNIVRTIHNTKIWDTWWWPGYISEKGLQNDLIISISNDTTDTYNELRRRYRLKASPFQRLISNGVSPARIQSQLEKQEFLEGISADPEKFQIGFFGRITEQKGVDILIEAMSIMTAQGVEFHIFGDGEYRQKLSKQADGLSLPVRFHGPIANAPNVMSAFDLIVMPSRFEGLSLVGLEAQMAGTPLLITDAPGMRELVSPGWPLIVAPESALALAEMLDQIVLGIYDLDHIARTGSKWVKKYGVETMALEYESAYLSFLKEQFVQSQRSCK
jgi:glycosyltransferase involved in cell wall biosynthesis